MRKHQQGVILLESLIAILIFSLGILALIGLQAQAVRYVNDAKFRADASFQANKLIARMWLDAVPTLGSYATGGAGFNDWATEFQEAKLPNGDANPMYLPNATAVVVVTPDAVTPTRRATVSVRINWRAPQDVSAHTFTTFALISKS